MPEFKTTYRGTVYPWHCDHMGHMNVMWYTGKFDEATWQLIAEIGLTVSRLRKDGRGMAAVEQHTTYKRELFAGSLISIRSALLEVGTKSIQFMHEMINDETGEVAATTRLIAVYLDTNSRKSSPLPEDVIDRAKAGGARNGRKS